MASTQSTFLDGIDRQAVAEVCRKFNVSRLRAFGSAVRDDFKPDSDVDLLYDLKPGQPMSYIELEDFADALSPLFGGRYADLGEADQLHWYIRDGVIRSASVLYEE